MDVRRVGYQGEAGSYSDRVVGELFPAADRIGLHTFADAFAALAAGSVDTLVLPIENSTTGSVLPVLDRLDSGDARIVAEHLVEIRHVLWGLPGAHLDGIVEVLSHPQALAQVEEQLVARGWSDVPVHDTAGAVRLVAEAGDPRKAALAPPDAGRPFGLVELASDVVDRLHNTTRFVVLRADAGSAAEDADKTSIVFETLHQPGALALALTELGLRGANLTRIESRPGAEPWRYRFFVDLIHPPGEAGRRAIFEPPPATLAGLRILGTYRSAHRH